MLNPPGSAARRSSISTHSDRSSQPPPSHATAEGRTSNPGAAIAGAGGGTNGANSPSAAAAAGGSKAATSNAPPITGGAGGDGDQPHNEVKVIGPVSADSPRISALGTLRAIGIGQGVQIVETKGANNDSEVAAASRDTFRGVGHTKFILCVAFSPDGSLVASGSGDQLVILWDVKTSARRSALIGHNGGVRCVSFSHDGLFLASASSDHNCILWDVLRGNQRAQLKGHQMEVNSVCFSTDSSFLFSAGVDKTIFVWDLRQPVVQLLTKLSGHTNHIHSIATSPDGHYMLSAGSDRQIIVWDTQRGDFKQIDALIKHTRDVHCISFSLDGQYFATGGSDALIVIWNANTFSEHTTLKGHTNRVMSVAWAPSGTLLASASMDKSVGIWDPIKGGGMKGQFKEHGHQVYSVSFPRTPGGPPIMVSGSFANSFILWDIIRGRVTATLDGSAVHKSNVQKVEWVQLLEASHRLLVRSTDFSGEELLWDAESGRTTQLDRVMEQESKLREMDDMRIHQEKMIKLAKQRQQQADADKRAEARGEAGGGDGIGDLDNDGLDSAPSGMWSGDGPGAMSPQKFEQILNSLPEKIAHAVAHSPEMSSTRRKLHGHVHGAGALLDGQQRSNDGGSRVAAGDLGHQVAGDDRSQASFEHLGAGGVGGGGGGLGDYGGAGGHHRSSFSFGSGGGGGRHGGGSRDAQADTEAILQAVSEVREAQRATSKEVADLQKDISAMQSDMKTMQTMMAEMMKLLQQGGGGGSRSRH